MTNAHESTPDFRIKPEPKIAPRVKAFVGDILVDIIVGVLLDILHGKLAKVNEEGIARQYRDHVFTPYVQPSFTLAVEYGRTEQWYGRKDDWWKYSFVYLEHKYVVRVHQELSTFSDAVITVADILRGSARIAETFVHVRPDVRPIPGPHDDWSPQSVRDYHVWSVPRGRRFQPTFLDYDDKLKDNIKDYYFVGRVLAHDPKVRSAYNEAVSNRSEVLALLQRSRERAWNRKPEPWIANLGDALGPVLADYGFLRGLEMLADPRLVPKKRQNEFDPVRFGLERADYRLALYNRHGDSPSLKDRWANDQKALLVAYLGVDPFQSRDRVIGRMKK